MKRSLIIAALGLIPIAGIFAILTSEPEEDVHTKLSAVAIPPPKATVAALKYPDVPKLGEDKTEVCADCHPDHVEGFKSTGMGKSLYAMKTAPVIETWTEDASRVVDKKTGLVYTAYRDNEGRFWQKETLPGTDYQHILEAQLAVGSGNSTRSYLGWLEGSLVQLPLTYYVEIKKWDLSPGYESNNLRMSRPITPKCLFCHNDLSQNIEGTLASYNAPFAAGISCDRCHGDGSAHVEYRMAGGIPKEGEVDKTILNPKHLDANRQQQVCEQCHLQGRSRRLRGDHTWDRYDPRQPLHEFMTIYVEQSDTSRFGIASHGARMQQSECFKKSQFGCAHCHNPHQKSTKETYVDACKGCHETGCSEPKHINGYCPECHMPKGTPSDIPHVTFSDHYIRVVNPIRESNAKTARLVDPHAELRSLTPAEEARNLVIAHFDDLEPNDSEMEALSKQVVSENLVEDIEAAPKDWNALETLASYYLESDRFAQAATALEQMRQLRPNDAHNLLELAYALARNGESFRAEEILKTVPKHLKFRPRYGDVLTELAVKDKASTMQLLKPYLTQHPVNDRAPLMFAGRALEANQPSKAAKIIREALQRDPVSPTLLFMMSNLEFDQRNYAATVVLLDRLLLSNPSFDAGRWLRARCHKKLGRLSASIDDLKITHKNQPRDAAILEDLLRTLRDARRTDEALKLLQKSRNELDVQTYKRLHNAFFGQPK